MSHAHKELEKVLGEDVADGYVTPAQADEVEAQRRLFEANRHVIHATHKGMIVAYAGGGQFVGVGIAEVIRRIEAAHPGAVFYAEQIPA